MAPSLVRPQGHLSPAEALQLAQQAPNILRSNPERVSASPLSYLFSSPETSEIWVIYENLILACLRAGDNGAAHKCLERLVVRFGDANERIMGLKGCIKEAEAADDNDLWKVHDEYSTILKENPANIPISKRRAALLRSMGKVPESAAAVNQLLEISPTDAEAWSELADIYLSQGLYMQAIFAMEEVLVLAPNAWNMHARLGEVSLMAADTSTEALPHKHLAEALKRFCRSIELCDDYLRGYYGLRAVTDRVLAEPGRLKKLPESDGFSLPDQKTIEKLNATATKKLAEIVRRFDAKEKLWQGYDAAEVAAVRELLSKSSSGLVR